MLPRFWLYFLLIVCATVPKIASSAPIRNDANGHYYELVMGNTNWDNANTNSISRTHLGLAGHLATVTSPEEEAFIHSKFPSTTFWLGAIQAPGSAEPAGGFGWVTGETFAYTDWNSGEPNNAGSNGESPRIARIDALQRNGANKWNDVPRGDLAAGYLVEYDNLDLPIVVSITPANPTDVAGTKRAFSVSVSDENGISDIQSIWLMANTQIDWSSGATFIYVRASNELYLRDGDRFNGPITPGSGTLSNSAVSVDGSTVTVTPGTDGKTLTLSLVLQSKNPLAGTNTLWGLVQDNEDNVDPANERFGFVRKGSWTIVPQQAPTAFVTPGSKDTSSNFAAGSETNFSLELKDPNGAGDLDSGYILINNPDNLDWTNSFTLIYLPSSNRLYLRSTDGTIFIDGGIVGQGSGTLENEAGSVRLNGCSVTSIINGVRLVVPITFKSAFAGTKRVWTRAQDSGGNVAPDNDTPQGFKTEGLVTINAAPPSPPSASILIRGNEAGNGTTTSLATGIETTFTLTLSDPNGFGDLDSGYILINNPGAPDWSNGFTLIYLPSSNRLYLRSTDGSIFIDGGVVGQSSGTLENDAGRVRLGGCSATLIAGGVRLVVPITFKSAFAGTKQMWSRVQDLENNTASDSDAAFGFKTEGQLNITQYLNGATSPSAPSS